jgi:arylsulfatase A-like enzyme
MADPRFLKRYLDMGLDSTEAAYATLVEGMDKSLSDLLDFLKVKGVDQNTIIFFLSDNGGLSLPGQRGGQPHTHNLPLRAGKGSLYEGGIRNPMLIRWPGVARPGSAMETPVSVEDLFPTILDMAGIKNPKIIQTIDGKDLVPLLSGRTKDLGERSFFWHFPVKWTNQDGPAINFFSAVARGDWKLVVSLRTGKKELYNIRKDIGETQDLAAQHPDKVRELAVLLGERLKDMKTPMPGFKSTGLQVPYPHE